MATYPVELAPGASKEGKVCVAVGGGGGFIGSWLALDLKKKGFYVESGDGSSADCGNSEGEEDCLRPLACLQLQALLGRSAQVID